MSNRLPYTPSNWYWAVANSTTQVYSSAVVGYVPVSDPTYRAWLASGGKPTNIDSEASLWQVLAMAYPAGLPAANNAAQQQQTVSDLAAIPLSQLKIDFWLVNQVRALNGQAALTKAQFIAAVTALAVPS